MTQFQDILLRLADGKTLRDVDTKFAIAEMMAGQVDPVQAGAFLMALRVRGETVDEIVGAVRAMRDAMVKINAPEGAMDTCGTGGDGAHTYNISTAVAFVLAGGGVPIAKHGNRSVSSKSGSSDVLAALGVNLDATPETIERAIVEAGIGFMFAMKHHGAMRHVTPFRQSLGLKRTIFNLMGPLSNPAGVKHQVLGVFSADWLMPLAQVLRELGTTSAWVVHGADGLDELSTTGENKVVVLSKHGTLTEMKIHPKELGLPTAELIDLVGGDADHNAAAMQRLFDGEAGAYQDIVLLNAAAGFVVAERAMGLTEGLHLAQQSLGSGKAKQALDDLVRITNEK